MNINKSSDNLKTEHPNVQNNSYAERCAIFGSNMRKARKELGLTAADLAKFIGLSTAYVGLIERGERVPSLETLLKICDCLGRGIDSMMTSTDSKSQERGRSQKIPIQKIPTDKLEIKRKAVTGIIKTFDDKELDYLIAIMKGLKTVSSNNSTTTA